MRTTLLLLATPLLLAAPAAGQDFEGTISMSMTARELGETMRMKLYVTPARQAMVMTMPASAGPMAGQEVRMVVNPATSKMAMFMPAPPGMPGGGKGIKMVFNFGAAVAQTGAEAEATVSALGSTQVVAGMSCEDYEVRTNEGSFRMCVTTAMGQYRFPEMTGGSSPQMPGWVKAFGNRPVFPLKITADDGSMSAEVTAIEKGPVPAAIVDDNTPGYTEMGMPGMGG